MSKLYSHPKFDEMSEEDKQKYITDYVNIHYRYAKSHPFLTKVRPEHVEDFIQEIWIDLYKCTKKYKPEQSSFVTYAYNRGRKVAKDFMNAYKERARPKEKFENITAAKNKYNGYSYINKSIIEEYVDGILSPKEIDMIYDKIVSGKFWSDTASETGMSPRTIYDIVLKLKNAIKNNKRGT